MASGISVVKTMLTTNWDASNTDNVTPTIALITEYKKTDTRGDDWVLIYKVGGPATPAGSQAMDYSERISIDCRSMWFSDSVDYQTHGDKMQAEVERIVSANRTNIDSIWHELIPLDILDLDDKGRSVAKRVYDVLIGRRDC